jgi:hypothetical protein
MQRDISGHVIDVQNEGLAGSLHSETAAFPLLATEDSGSNALSSRRLFTPSSSHSASTRPDRIMLYGFAIYSLLCFSAMAAPLSLLRGSEPDGLMKVEPGLRDGWFAHGGGDGLLGSLGDILSGSLLDGVSGKCSPFHANPG